MLRQAGQIAAQHEHGWPGECPRDNRRPQRQKLPAAHEQQDDRRRNREGKTGHDMRGRDAAQNAFSRAAGRCCRRIDCESQWRSRGTTWAICGYGLPCGR